MQDEQVLSQTNRKAGHIQSHSEHLRKQAVKRTAVSFKHQMETEIKSGEGEFGFDHSSSPCFSPPKCTQCIALVKRSHLLKSRERKEKKTSWRSSRIRSSESISKSDSSLTSSFRPPCGCEGNVLHISENLGKAVHVCVRAYHSASQSGSLNSTATLWWLERWKYGVSSSLAKGESNFSSDSDSESEPACGVVDRGLSTRTFAAVGMVLQSNEVQPEDQKQFKWFLSYREAARFK